MPCLYPLVLIIFVFISKTGIALAQPGSPPALIFDRNDYPNTLDYADDRFWLALPDKVSPAQLQPKNALVQASETNQSIDVFYVHPTTYLSNASWIDPINLSSATHENKLWLLAHQASLFNVCCRIFAPLYRQASIYAYLEPNQSLMEDIFDVAYQDVRAAFRNFANSRNPKAPFILASHSQGTHHLVRLLAEEIDHTPLQERLIVAYTLGATIKPITAEFRSKLRTLKVCSNARDTGCFVHWDTAADRGRALMPESDSVCVNPLSWREDQLPIDATNHAGALPIRHPFILNFGPNDPLQGKPILNLEELQPSLTHTQCISGILRVTKLSSESFLNLNPAGNYHILDFSLFYRDIQINVAERIVAYRQQHTVGQTP